MAYMILRVAGSFAYEQLSQYLAFSTISQLSHAPSYRSAKCFGTASRLEDQVDIVVFKIFEVPAILCLATQFEY